MPVPFFCHRGFEGIWGPAISRSWVALLLGGSLWSMDVVVVVVVAVGSVLVGMVGEVALGVVGG